MLVFINKFVTLPAIALLAACLGNVTPAVSSSAHAVHQVEQQTVPVLKEHKQVFLAAGSAKWCRPFADPLLISRPFIAPAHAYAAGHRGIDVISITGATTQQLTVRAPAAGTVVFAGTVVDRPVVTVQVTADLVYSIEPVVSLLEPGQTVARCQDLAIVSKAGHTQPGEIHIGVRKQQKYVNPVLFFKPKPQLLPLKSS